MAETVSSGATPPGPQSVFSVLGGAITRAALQQAQRDIDILSEVSLAHACPTSGSHAAPLAASPQQRGASTSHPLQRVLDALRAAHLGSMSEGGNGEAPAQLGFASISVRDLLIHAFGVSAGSSLYREWIQAPRRRIKRVVRQLAISVQERYLPQLIEHHSLSREEPIDVHVQLYPSHTVQFTAVPAALREAKGFCAAVTVRRLSALEEEATAVRRLRDRYMQVAAQGQTLPTVLSFWAGASYGDVPPSALIDYPPLGFERDSSRLILEAAQASRGTAAADSARQRGRKAQRASDDQDEVMHPALLLGTREDSTTLSVARWGTEEEEGPEWLQPPLLLWPSDGLEDGQLALPSSIHSLNSAHHFRYENIGLLAVLYVHASGMAYVGYPQASDMASSTEPAEGPSQRPDDVPPANPMAVARALPPAPICSLPMGSTTGFVRSLLGLS
ncbi:hypothetical protein LSCM1_04339 [Leishmania martiniquensis]|uniref:Uncharacterized protein n=1 Tax=Leishmania martiniquensis TaxID=1580590 RepID=A0A836HB86_9TRYP|nr:hypothetical protein LSCM1_04339 [Leishmania martiniquensis]